MEGFFTHGKYKLVLAIKNHVVLESLAGGIKLVKGECVRSQLDGLILRPKCEIGISFLFNGSDCVGMENRAILATGSDRICGSHNLNLALAAFVSDGHVIIGIWIGGFDNCHCAGIIVVNAFKHIHAPGIARKRESKQKRGCHNNFFHFLLL